MVNLPAEDFESVLNKVEFFFACENTGNQLKPLHQFFCLTFSLFSCTSVLDSMLFKATEPQDVPIQNTLLHDIVNPLRRCLHALSTRHTFF